jgi:MSHA pilin protein MshC
MAGMKARGFTLIELILVIMITGILAVAVAPRFFDRKVFESRGFHDETLAALRYAQKQAVAQRRTVCVAFTADTVTLTIVQNAGSSDCITAAAVQNLTGPTGISPFQIAAKSGVTFTATPANFSFNGLGQPQPFNATGLPRLTAPKVISVVDVATSIIIEPETGHVR